MWKKFLSAFEIFIHFLNSSLNSKIIKSLGENLSQFQPWNFHRNESAYNCSQQPIQLHIFHNSPCWLRESARRESFTVLLLVESQVGSCRLFVKYGEERGKKKKKKNKKERSKGEKKREKKGTDYLTACSRYWQLDTVQELFQPGVFCSSKRRTEAAC